jgi:hypothetical protein
MKHPLELNLTLSKALILIVNLNQDAYCIQYNKVGEEDEEATTKYVMGIANQKCRNTKVQIEREESLNDQRR